MNQPLTETELVELRGAAEAATKGAWINEGGELLVVNADGGSLTLQCYLRVPAPEMVAAFRRIEDADHIAAFDPPTALRLLDDLAAAKLRAEDGAADAMRAMLRETYGRERDLLGMFPSAEADETPDHLLTEQIGKWLWRAVSLSYVLMENAPADMTGKQLREAAEAVTAAVLSDRTTVSRLVKEMGEEWQLAKGFEQTPVERWRYCPECHSWQIHGHKFNCHRAHFFATLKPSAPTEAEQT